MSRRDHTYRFLPVTTSMCSPDMDVHVDEPQADVSPHPSMMDIPPDIPAGPDVLPQEPEQDAPTVQCNVATLQHQSGPQTPEINTDVGTPSTVQQPQAAAIASNSPVLS